MDDRSRKYEHYVVHNVPIYAYHAEDDGKNIRKEPVIAFGCYYDEEWGTNETIPLVVAKDGLCSPLDMPNFLRIASEDDTEG